MRLKVIGLIAFLLFLAAVAVSQHPPMQGPQQHPGQGPHPGPDPIAQNLFAPELVMQHRQALALTEEQKAAIKDEMLKASAKFNELQWQMPDEMETLVSLIKGSSVDEQRALAQLEKILNIEREVKRTQLMLAIRIKNKLTAEQQAKLIEIQRNSHDVAPRAPER